MVVSLSLVSAFSDLVLAEMCPIVKISSQPWQIALTIFSEKFDLYLIESNVFNKNLQRNLPFLSLLAIVSEIFKI